MYVCLCIVLERFTFLIKSMHKENDGTKYKEVILRPYLVSMDTPSTPSFVTTVANGKLFLHVLIL